MKRTILRGAVTAAVLAAGVVPAGALALTTFDHAPTTGVLHDAPTTTTVRVPDGAARHEPAPGAPAPTPSEPAAPSSTRPEEHPSTTPAPRPAEPAAPTTVKPAEPPRTEPRTGETGQGTPANLPTFSLSCEPRPGTSPFRVVCRWGTPDVAPASYQLLRFTRSGDSVVPGSRVVLTTTAGHELVDETGTPGTPYVYAALGVDGAGGVVAHSPVSFVVVPDAPAPTAPPTTAANPNVALRCLAPMVDGGRRTTCTWTASGLPKAAGYRLTKSTNGAEPVTVGEVGADGTRSLNDPVLPGQQVTYRVLVLDAGGAVIGTGGPVSFVVPPLENVAH